MSSTDAGHSPMWRSPARPDQDRVAPDPQTGNGSDGAREWVDVLVQRARAVERPGHAVIATDIHGTVIYWGPGAEWLYGWAARDTVGRSVVEVTPTDMSRSDAESILHNLAAGKSWRGEFMVRAKGGRNFTVEVTDIPVRDHAGRLIGIIGSSRPIDQDR
jgi:PAS domain S-box-containing protein